MLNNIFSTSTSRDLSVRRVTGDFYQLKISKNTMVKSMTMIPKKKRMKTKTRYLYIKAGSESQEIESRPKISGPGYSNGLLDTRKCAVLFVLMQF